MERHVAHDGEVEVVGAGDGVEDQRVVLDGAGHRANLVERVARRHDAVAADPSEGGTEPHDPATDRRRQDRTAGIGADGEADETGGGSAAGTRRGSTRSLLGVPRVVRAAAEPLVSEGELAGRELGDQHRSSRVEPLDDGRIEVEHLVLERRGAPGGPVAVHGDDVLGAPRDAVERAPVPTRGDLLVGLARLLERSLRSQRHDAVEHRIQPLQPLQVHPGQFDGAHLPGLDQPGEMRHRPEGDVLEIRRTRHLGRPAQPERAVAAVETHPGNDRIEIERRRHRVVERDLPHLVVVAEVLVRLIDHEVVFLVGEVESGEGRGFPHHPRAHLRRAGILHPCPQAARKQRPAEPRSREIREESPTRDLSSVSHPHLLPGWEASLSATSRRTPVRGRGPLARRGSVFEAERELGGARTVGRRSHLAWISEGTRVDRPVVGPVVLVVEQVEHLGDGGDPHRSEIEHLRETHVHLVQRLTQQRIPRRLVPGSGSDHRRTVESRENVRVHLDRIAEIQAVPARCLPVRPAADRGVEAVPGAVEVRAREGDAVGQLIDPVQAQRVLLEIERRGPLGGRVERVVGEIEPAPRVVVLVEDDRVGQIDLEVIPEPAPQTARQRQVVLLAGALDVADLRELGIETARDVVAGHRVMDLVRIGRTRRVVLLPVEQIGIEAPQGPELLLNPDGGLPRVRQGEVMGDRPRRLGRHGHFAVQDLLGCHASGRILQEARHPVVRERVHQDALAVEGLLGERDVRRADRVIDPRATANDQIAVAADVIRESAARCDVVRVADVPLEERVSGAPAGARARERGHDVVSGRRQRAPVEVVADAEVQNQAIRGPPRVPRPDGPGRPRDVDDPVPDVLAEARYGRIESAHIPAARRRGALDREPALEIVGPLVEDELAALEEVPFAPVLPAQELPAELHIVVGPVPVQLKAGGEDILREQLGVVPGPAERDAREDVVREARGLIALGTEGLVAASDRGVGQLVRPLEAVVADLQLGEDVLAPHMGPGGQRIQRILRSRPRIRRMLGTRHAERGFEVPVGDPVGEEIVVAGGVVHAGGETVLRLGRLEHPLLVRKAGGLDEDAARLPLVLVGQEVVDPVADDGPAEHAADLLVLEGQHLFRDVILGIEPIVAEIAVETRGEVIRARPGDGVHLTAGRTALGHVELIRDDLELGDRFAAELGLAETGTRHLLGDLLAVEVELETLVAGDAGTVVVRVVGRDALDQQRKLHPVASLHRKVIHHAAIHVAGDFRRHEVHEGRLRGDGDRLLDAGERHLDGDRGVLAHQKLDLRHQHVGESGERRLHPIETGRKGRGAEGARAVGHDDILASGVVVGHRDRDSRQRAPRGVLHLARERRRLLGHGAADREQKPQHHKSRDRRVLHPHRLLRAGAPHAMMRPSNPSRGYTRRRGLWTALWSAALQSGTMSRRCDPGAALESGAP